MTFLVGGLIVLPPAVVAAGTLPALEGPGVIGVGPMPPKGARVPANPSFGSGWLGRAQTPPTSQPPRLSRLPLVCPCPAPEPDYGARRSCPCSPRTRGWPRLRGPPSERPQPCWPRDLWPLDPQV